MTLLTRSQVKIFKCQSSLATAELQLHSLSTDAPPGVLVCADVMLSGYGGSVNVLKYALTNC